MIINQDIVFVEGKMVTVNWGGEKVPAEIIALEFVLGYKTTTAF